MNEVKDIIKNKKFIIIAIAVLAIIILTIILCVTVKGKSSEQERLTASLKELGVDFYENFYYNQTGTEEKTRTEFLEKYKDLGIKVSLSSLARYKQANNSEENVLEKFVNSKTKEACDADSSKVVIYPKSPYGKTDYYIDAILVCGFEIKEEV